MLVDKDAHQRETITKWPIWLAIKTSSVLYSVCLVCLYGIPISSLLFTFMNDAKSNVYYKDLNQHNLWRTSYHKPT